VDLEALAELGLSQSHRDALAALAIGGSVDDLRPVSLALTALLETATASGQHPSVAELEALAAAADAVNIATDHLGFALAHARTAVGRLPA
jgi:hypothetical protein